MLDIPCESLLVETGLGLSSSPSSNLVSSILSYILSFRYLTFFFSSFKGPCFLNYSDIFRLSIAALIFSIQYSLYRALRLVSSSSGAATILLLNRCVYDPMECLRVYLTVLRFVGTWMRIRSRTLRAFSSVVLAALLFPIFLIRM